MSKHKLALFLILTTLSQAHASERALHAFMSGRKIDPKHTALCKATLVNVGASLASCELSAGQARDFDKKLAAAIKTHDRETDKEAGRKQQQKTAQNARNTRLAARSARHRHS